MWPYLLRVPLIDRPLPTFGLALAIAFLLAIWTTARLSEREGISKTAVYGFAFCLLPSCLLGTKLLMALSARDSLAGTQPQFSTVAASSALGGYWGGLLLALVVSVLLTRLWQMPWTRMADAWAPALALANIVGRIGCFLAGCCWGRPTTSWIGVKFTEQAHWNTGVPIDVMLVPTQLIQAGLNVLSFGFLFWLWKRRAFAGQIILAYLILYSLERFVMDFWRADDSGSLLGCSVPRLIAIGVSIPAFTLMICLWRRAHRSADLEAAIEPRPSSL